VAATLEACLADLDRRLNDAQEQTKRQEWERFLAGQWEGEYFRPSPRTPAPPTVDWPDIHINDAIEDVDLMVLSEFKGCSDTLAAGGNGPLNVRSNYGTAIMPLLFGCELFVMPREMGTLPTAVPLHSDEGVRRLIDAGAPDPRTGYAARVFDAGERFNELFETYPNVGRHVFLYHPDTQGPVDIAEMVWGSEMFYAFIEQADLVKALLRLLTDSYAEFMRRWFELAPTPPEFAPHWGLVHQGRLMIRNDSLMNLSGEMYVEFVRPFDQELFDEFGGGAIHFCGRGDHFIEAMSEMTGLAGINLSQPELNDMETVFRHTVDKGIKLVGFGGMDLDNVGRPLRGLVQTA
jgi:hypothetical protein